MKTISTNEWVAVTAAVFVVGFFFIFGQTLLSVMTGKTTKENMMQNQNLGAIDSVIGGGEVAATGDLVTVHYVGRFTDGNVFDSSLSRNEPYKFELGAGGVIKGWDLGIVGMREGGKRTLTIPPELGYGAKDFGPIPGGSTLIFDVELLKVEKK